MGIVWALYKFFLLPYGPRTGWLGPVCGVFVLHQSFVVMNGYLLFPLHSKLQPWPSISYGHMVSVRRLYYSSFGIAVRKTLPVGP